MLVDETVRVVGAGGRLGAHHGRGQPGNGVRQAARRPWLNATAAAADDHDIRLHTESCARHPLNKKEASEESSSDALDPDSTTTPPGM